MIRSDIRRKTFPRFFDLRGAGDPYPSRAAKLPEFPNVITRRRDPRATWFGGSRGATQNLGEAPRFVFGGPTKTGAMNTLCTSAGARLLGGDRLSLQRRWYWTGGTTVWSEALLLKTLRVLEPSPAVREAATSWSSGIAAA
jgi:hypothetical protein